MPNLLPVTLFAAALLLSGAALVHLCYRRPLLALLKALDAEQPLAGNVPCRLPTAPSMARLTRQIATLQNSNVQLHEQAVMDPLTGLGNRRMLEQRLEVALPISRRWMKAVSALMIDVDHFKDYNDLYGHQAGDECLIEIANVLRDTFRRETDIVVRLGGEEFLVVLLDANAMEATRLAEAMRGMLQAVGIPHRGSNVADVVTVSIGVSTTHSGSAFYLEDMIASADTALYACKAKGRNCVTSHTIG
ncbi:GGDEF domain-containing protein [Franzmannia qiaohouensis]|uniref:diguanylate cyclase n=1 Tax=Franzmannia qiaohouensis TaxID=1329370 RepID=A0ABU1HGR5_9GAMM|nr:GGDEF domain-containing protein [Halomonas qiaohouensis]MDR5906669.1 GGDEF domain-containing protein [Halomonas qiaohouensis]